MSNLSYDSFRDAMDARIGSFEKSTGVDQKNRQAAFDRPLSYWAMALAGEVGEMCNLMKKVERGDYTLETLIKDNHTNRMITVREAIAKEAGDIEAYQHLIAIFLKFDLGKATEDKFNEISQRCKSNVFIDNGEPYIDLGEGDRRYL